VPGPYVDNSLTAIITARSHILHRTSYEHKTHIGAFSSISFTYNTWQAAVKIIKPADCIIRHITKPNRETHTG